MKTCCALAAMMLMVAVVATAETTNALSKAEIEGRELARQLCEARPTENFTNTGVLKIRGAKGMTTNVPIEFRIIATATNWVSVYIADYSTLRYVDDAHNYVVNSETIGITHAIDQSEQYEKTLRHCGVIAGPGGIMSCNAVFGSHTNLFGERTIIPFANSDFWLCDLGLEFFHWPGQKVLKHEMRRGRSCTVLESSNPSPATNGYSRVVSWIDHESGGIVQAEAYDFKNGLLKEFAPKSFKKVNGQWQLQEMEIRNVQTGSRTRLEFNLTTE